MFEVAALSLHLAAAGAVSRERAQDVALRNLRTTQSETWTVDGVDTNAGALGTGDVVAEEDLVSLLADTTRLVHQYSRLLPPVDHEAEARIDAVMAAVHQHEKRAPIRRRRG